MLHLEIGSGIQRSHSMSQKNSIEIYLKKSDLSWRKQISGNQQKRLARKKARGVDSQIEPANRYYGLCCQQIELTQILTWKSLQVIFLATTMRPMGNSMSELPEHFPCRIPCFTSLISWLLTTVLKCWTYLPRWRIKPKSDCAGIWLGKDCTFGQTILETSSDKLSHYWITGSFDVASNSCGEIESDQRLAISHN